MKASLLLVAALLFLCGMSFLRRSRQPGSDAPQSLLLGIVCWLLSVIFALVAAMAIAKAQGAIPVNPDVTPENIKSTVCVPNWDKPVRPKTSVTNKIKFAKMAALDIPKEDSAKYELDHILPLVLGGAPHDPDNLRVQEWYGEAVDTPKGAGGLDTQAHVKDVLEVRLHKLVCSGQLDLREAQRCIYEDWRSCAIKYPAH